MRFLNQFLERINRLWHKKAEVMTFGTLGKGSGKHNLFTIRGGKVYFHSLPFSEQLEELQEIDIDNMTVEELITTARSMGYSFEGKAGVDVSKAFNLSALTIIEIENRNIVNGTYLYVFQTNFWRVLYPIHRVLYRAELDIDKAIEQLSLPSTKGEWVDFWAGYFDIKRLPEEPDELLIRRIFMSLTSVKSNDVAIEELVSFYIGATVYVNDYLPNLFEVRVSPEFMESSQKVRDIIKTLKGGGVDYILNYATLYTENYPTYFRSVNGKSFSEMNDKFLSVHLKSPRFEENYGLPPMDDYEGFTMNESSLNQTDRLTVTDVRIQESLRMVMTKDGKVIQEM